MAGTLGIRKKCFNKLNDEIFASPHKHLGVINNKVSCLFLLCNYNLNKFNFFYYLKNLKNNADSINCNYVIDQ